ncbi:2OG-Fe(II) oxygenase [Deminuibacter soli]|uniref:Prolyl 4-hydroxylase subunit alpha n=1 Tax=Deminuibacter soli TaxID=2291815 RepID=A0A3E1NGQ2_9BACT|nr:2OG-Fe(II) oxygenase [Deminuibacter soli]RFM26968.1 prolyl 4-hydroxylase subunit alpha [Deminuibacter soli]
MLSISERIRTKDWTAITQQLHQQGYALVPDVVSTEECSQLIQQYNADLYRKTIKMERYRFGLGEYKYFRYPLPALIQQLRETVYPLLAPVANEWMRQLGIGTSFPVSFHHLQQLCHSHKQVHPTVLTLKYGAGGFNTLHQDLYGDIWFPMQLVLFLNDAGKNYTGGEFVLTEQVPRAQSQAIVLQPPQGSMLLFTTSFRPVKGSRGYYRVNMKHGVSRLHSGERHTLGIIFHDALS